MGARIIGMPHDDASSTVLDQAESACPSAPPARTHFTDQQLAKMTDGEDWGSEPISQTQQVNADTRGVASSCGDVVQDLTRVFEGELDRDRDVDTIPIVVEDDPQKPPASGLPHGKLEVKAPPPTPPVASALAASKSSSPSPLAHELPPPSPPGPNATYAVLPEKHSVLQMNIDDRELAMDPQPFFQGNALGKCCGLPILSRGGDVVLSRERSTENSLFFPSEILNPFEQVG